jgi:hypothetical protein
MGTWFLERDLTPRYGYMYVQYILHDIILTNRGTNREGCGGLGEQIPFQGLDPHSILLKAKQLMK